MSDEMAQNQVSAGESYFRQIEKAVDFIKRKISHVPTIAIALENGFDDLVKESLETPTVLPTRDIPHFPTPSVNPEKSMLVFGKLAGKSVLVFDGRVHTYDGFSASQVAFGSVVASFLGCRTFVFTTVAGSLNPAFRPGHVMVMTNHISVFCPDPAEGLQYPQLGPHFYDQTDPYDGALVEKTIAIGRDAGATMQRGVYVFTRGPRYESRADIQMLHSMGADAVGMSTLPEVLALKRLGVEKIVGLASITNMAAGIATTRITEAEVASQQKLVKPQVHSILTKLITDCG